MRGGMAFSVGKWANIVLVLLLASGAAHVAYRAWWLPSWRSWPCEPFSAENWRNTPGTGRYVFWKDLRSRGLLLGLSRQDVIELLGPPDSDQGVYVTYILKGRDPREYTLDSVYFIDVGFDSSGRVARAFIRSD